MSSNFLTVEDVNSICYANKGFYWHTIDTSLITESSEDFTDVRYDFCTISRELTDVIWYKYTIRVDNSMFTLGYCPVENIPSAVVSYSNSVITVRSTKPYIVLDLYLGPFKLDSVTKINCTLRDGDSINLNLKELETPQRIYYIRRETGSTLYKSFQLEKGYNWISDNDINYIAGYLLVNLLKTDFQFNPTQTLKIGQNNKVLLGTDTDYKPNGDLIGEYSPNITIEYNNEIIPVEWSTVDNDYTFNLDLTDITEPSTVKFKVNVEANDVLNHTKTDVTLECDYDLITTFDQLKTLLTNGGTGKLGNNLTIYHELVEEDVFIPINHDVQLIGNDKTINMNFAGFIVKEAVTFKANNVTFYHGVHTLYQEKNTNVELTDCTFDNCYGLGACIKCDVDIESLNNSEDFITTLNNCTFNNNSFAIIHGGELIVNNCTVTETPKEGYNSWDYPYFLYQTDGNVDIRNSSFTLTKDEPINEDMKFYPCVFICGENAQINGYNHIDLQNNNVGFLANPYNNRSSINLTYYYDYIEDNITLQSSKGFCHGVSGVDYVFKTNVTIQRS